MLSDTEQVTTSTRSAHGSSEPRRGRLWLALLALPTDFDDPAVVYCRSGNMSAQAADDLVAAGSTNVIDMPRLSHLPASRVKEAAL